MQHHATLIRTAEVDAYQHPETESTVVTHYSERLGIDAVRLITAQALLRPATNHGHIFIIATNFVTHEAQNALLKLFEEPPADTSFVLVVPPALQLLATVQSRIGQEIVMSVPAESQVWLSFVNSSYATRLQQIADWQKSKNSQWIAEITSGVHTLSSQKASLEVAHVVRLVGQKINTRGASNKMLLEHLALAIPLR